MLWIFHDFRILTLTKLSPNDILAVMMQLPINIRYTWTLERIIPLLGEE